MRRLLRRRVRVGCCGPRAIRLAQLAAVGAAAVLMVSRFTADDAAWVLPGTVLREDDEALKIVFSAPVQPSMLQECFSHVQSTVPSASYGSGIVVLRMSSLAAESTRTGKSLEETATTSLRGLLAGGLRGVVLVPGHRGVWTTTNVERVRQAVRSAVDFHGGALDVSFAAVPPATVQCAGVGHVGAGVAWALASGAASVVDLAHIAALSRMALFFEPGLPRFLQQAALATQASPSPPLRKHFLVCGGDADRCDVRPDALQV
jgi:hypothetical protein